MLDISLILISNNEQRSLSALNYYLNYRCKIIVAASTQTFYESLSSVFADNKYVDLIPPSGNEDSLFMRLKNVNNYLETKYFAIVSDDDLLVLSGLEKGVNYLDSNTNCSCYFGICFQMIFTSLYFPFFTSMYSPNFIRSESVEFITNFNQYRQYPFIYGVSRSLVFSRFVDLLGLYSTKWAGVWELAYALSSSTVGNSYYDENNLFLLRLAHPSSRTSLDDYPLPPKANLSVDQYISKFIDLETFRKYIYYSEYKDNYEQILLYVFKDIFDDSFLHQSYPSVPINYTTDLKIAAHTFKRTFRSFRAFTLIFRHLLSSLYYALKYLLCRNKFNVQVIFSNSLF